MEEQDSSALSLSFSIYSADRLTEIAGTVAEAEKIEGNENDGEFEFCVGGVPIGSSLPVFDGGLLEEKEAVRSRKELESSIRDLFIEDRDRVIGSDSSSEEDEFEAIPPESYCVWPPITRTSTDSPPPRCLKSGSSRSASLRWKLRNFLHRSNSDGQNRNSLGIGSQQKLATSSLRTSGRRISSSVGGAGKVTSLHEDVYVRKRLMTKEEKKKSYLPYRRDVLGVFSFSKSLR